MKTTENSRRAPSRTEKAGGREDLHKCPVPGCTALVLPSMLMCRDHWWALPSRLRMAVLRAYRDAQRTGQKMPTREWTQAAMEAVKFCAPLYRLREVREARLQ
ncbi:MAG: hypothetical protein Q8O40_11965 [Chloroflexota bacterium]|nr:hypothetical protein [Chloroflexota bacterium]